MATVSFSKFSKSCIRAKNRIKDGIAPYRTGNLANNALKIEFPSKNVCYIYVDESVAPYMPYTTKPWISPRWHGKKNPNEGWWQRAGESVADAIADKVGGEPKTAGGEKFTLQF